MSNLKITDPNRSPYKIISFKDFIKSHHAKQKTNNKKFELYPSQYEQLKREYIKAIPENERKADERKYLERIERASKAYETWIGKKRDQELEEQEQKAAAASAEGNESSTRKNLQKILDARVAYHYWLKNKENEEKLAKKHKNSKFQKSIKNDLQNQAKRNETHSGWYEWMVKREKELVEKEAREVRRLRRENRARSAIM